jgi:hypothetical protein
MKNTKGSARNNVLGEESREIIAGKSIELKGVEGGNIIFYTIFCRRIGGNDGRRSRLLLKLGEEKILKIITNLPQEAEELVVELQ